VNGVFVFCLFLFQRGGHLGKKKITRTFSPSVFGCVFFSPVRPTAIIPHLLPVERTVFLGSIFRSIRTWFLWLLFFFLRAGSKEYDWAFDGVLCLCFSLLYCVVLVAVVLDVCAFFLAPP
jgi:hypothetical protein